MKYCKFIWLTVFFLNLFSHLHGQEAKLIIARALIINGDTVLQGVTPPMEIKSYRIYRSPKEKAAYEKLLRNVKKVYPYAKLAGQKLREYEVVLKAAPNDRERRKIMRKAEDELNAKFGSEIKKLTYSQGKVLIKLIDRETGNSSYSLLQELRGKFTAFLWQSLARIFGYNLKVKYDPYGEDAQIEDIVQQIEKGQILLN